VSAPSDPRTLVLHGVRLKGFAEADAVAEAASIALAETAAVLEELCDQGLASRRDGRVSGYALTPAGRIQHAELLAEELDNAGVRGKVQETYQRFFGLNATLLGVCTDWQLREVDGESTLNDHTDAGYDAGVIAQLSELHAQVEPICADLAALLDRYAAYGPRLEHAIDRVRSGDTDWFTKPMIPSYHTVWFELHEDLLSTLGIERGSEVTA
jgi:hypothetical protein